MKIVLINPPFYDPIVPPASLAALAESLSSAADVVAVDLNLEVFNLLFDSSEHARNDGDNLAEIQVEDTSKCITVGKQFRSAFQSGIPAILEMKGREHQIQAVLNTSAGRSYRVGRGSLEPCNLFPPSELSSSLNQFSCGIFGKAVESAVFKILTAVESAECVMISMTLAYQVIPTLRIAQLLRHEGYHGIIALGGMKLTHTHEYLATHSLMRELIDVVYVGEFPFCSEEFVNYCTALSRVERKERALTVLHSGDFETTNTAHAPFELTSNGSGYACLPLGGYWGEPLIGTAISKGCYFGKCAFCNQRRGPASSAKECDYIHNSPEQAIRRITSIQEKLGVSVLSLESDVIDPKTLVETARGLAQQGTRLTWCAASRLEDELTRRLLEELYEGGCRYLLFGFESASPPVVRRMGKGSRLDIVKRILGDCAEIGIATELSLFFGFPGEQENDAMLTLDFLAEHSYWIHRLNVGAFDCIRSSPIGHSPEKYDIEIVGPASDWEYLVWRDLTGTTLKDPQRFVECALAIQPERFLLSVPEDQLLVCKYGVSAVEEQLLRYSVQ